MWFLPDRDLQVMPAVEQLSSLIPPPHQPQYVPTSKDWQKFIEVNGVDVPPEFRTLVNVYGVGCFDNFLWLYSPITPNQYLNICEKTKLRASKFDVYRRAGLNVPFVIYPESKGVMIWGGTDNGDALCWKTAEATGEVVINQGSLHEWEDTHMAIPEFLLKLFRREYKCRLFPDDFPSDTPKFVPWREQQN